MKLTHTQAATLAFIKDEIAAGRNAPGPEAIREAFGMASIGASGYRLDMLIRAGALSRHARGVYELTEAGRNWRPRPLPVQPMTLEELDDALCIVEAGCEPGWIPRQVARRKIVEAFKELGAAARRA